MLYLRQIRFWGVRGMDVSKQPQVPANVFDCNLNEELTEIQIQKGESNNSQ